jgi:hypothetical protein
MSAITEAQKERAYSEAEDWAIGADERGLHRQATLGYLDPISIIWKEVAVRHLNLLGFPDDPDSYSIETAERR